MRAVDIKRMLRPYSILAQRKTTMTNAFVSAIAPTDRYDPSSVSEGMAALGQRDLEDLSCVYCGQRAETWDHVYPLVSNREPSGNGHTVGNLVPACRACNTAKGNREWVTWSRARSISPDRSAAIQRYLLRFPPKRWTTSQLRERCQHLLEAYDEKRDSIFALMKEADGIAAQIRDRMSSC